jgi:hypothetical protein
MNAKSVKAASVSDLDKKREEVRKEHPAMPEDKVPVNKVLSCRHDIETAMDVRSQDGERFNLHGSLGWSVYFGYKEVIQGNDFGKEPVEMAFKVQPAETHDEMVAVWDMHCLSESKEKFIEMYSKWYDMYKVPHMEASKKGGGDDAVANS